MNTLNLTTASISSKLVVAIALISAAAAVSLAFHNGATAKNTLYAINDNSVPQVVIIGARMSAEEKLAYDLVPQEIARVEIVGKRLSQDEKLAMMVADATAVKPVSTHRKA